MAQKKPETAKAVETNHPAIFDMQNIQHATALTEKAVNSAVMSEADFFAATWPAIAVWLESGQINLLARLWEKQNHGGAVSLKTMLEYLNMVPVPDPLETDKTEPARISSLKEGKLIATPKRSRSFRHVQALLIDAMVATGKDSQTILQEWHNRAKEAKAKANKAVPVYSNKAVAEKMESVLNWIRKTVGDEPSAESKEAFRQIKALADKLAS